MMLPHTMYQCFGQRRTTYTQLLHKMIVVLKNLHALIVAIILSEWHFSHVSVMTRVWITPCADSESLANIIIYSIQCLIMMTNLVTRLYIYYVILLEYNPTYKERLLWNNVHVTMASALYILCLPLLLTASGGSVSEWGVSSGITKVQCVMFT